MNIPFKLTAAQKRELQNVVADIEFDVIPRGWKRRSGVGSFHPDIYFNRRLGIVVKRFSTILDPHTPLAVRAPTIKVVNDWYVQPIVRRINLKRAEEIIRKRLIKIGFYKRGGFPDLHYGNVGWYNEEAVLFDW